MKKEIKCPKCHVVVLHYDGKSTMTYAVRCKKCGGMVVFTPPDTIHLNEPPRRTTSSGARFW